MALLNMDLQSPLIDEKWLRSVRCVCGEVCSDTGYDIRSLSMLSIYFIFLSEVLFFFLLHFFLPTREMNNRAKQAKKKRNTNRAFQVTMGSQVVATKQVYLLIRMVLSPLGLLEGPWSMPHEVCGVKLFTLDFDRWGGD